MDVSKQLDADFNFPKIHLISHWVKQRCQYGALQQYSAETHGQAHEMNLTDGCNASNPNFNYLPWVMTFQCHILGLEIRELNLQALAQHWGKRPAACTVFSSGAELAAPTELPVICEAQIYQPPKLPWCKASSHYDQRLQSITQQYTRHNTPRCNIQRHAGDYQA